MKILHHSKVCFSFADIFPFPLVQRCLLRFSCCCCSAWPLRGLPPPSRIPVSFLNTFFTESVKIFFSYIFCISLLYCWLFLIFFSACCYCIIFNTYSRVHHVNKQSMGPQIVITGNWYYRTFTFCYRGRIFLRRKNKTLK